MTFVNWYRVPRGVSWCPSPEALILWVESPSFNRCIGRRSEIRRRNRKKKMKRKKRRTEQEDWAGEKEKEDRYDDNGDEEEEEEEVGGDNGELQAKSTGRRRGDVGRGR